MSRRLLLSLGVVSFCLSLLVPLYGLPILTQVLHLGAGFQAKTLCSSLWVSGRTLESIHSAELHGDGDLLFQLLKLSVTTDIDADAKTVTVSDRFGLGIKRLAGVRSKHLGCTLIASTVEQTEFSYHSLDEFNECTEIPSNFQQEGIDRSKLNATLSEEFLEDDQHRPKRTRAVLVVHKGELIAERYGGGFTKDTPQLGWSMTKTLLAALIGKRLDEDFFPIGLHRGSFGKAFLKNEWNKSSEAITLADMLQMSAGVNFPDNDYGVLGGVVQMLFGEPDSAAYASTYKLLPQPHFAYSSGVSNLISRALRSTFGSDDEYWAYPRRALLEPLEMCSAVIETDEAGTFVGSSFWYAVPRDYAKFGLMLLNNGRSHLGDQVLSSEFVNWMKQAGSSTKGHYGGHLWINHDGRGPLPSSLISSTGPVYAALGHDCQAIFVLPKLDVVVVRLGFTPKKHNQCHMARLLQGVYDSLTPPSY